MNTIYENREKWVKELRKKFIYIMKKVHKWNKYINKAKETKERRFYKDDKNKNEKQKCKKQRKQRENEKQKE